MALIIFSAKNVRNLGIFQGDRSSRLHLKPWMGTPSLDGPFLGEQMLNFRFFFVRCFLALRHGDGGFFQRVGRFWD